MSDSVISNKASDSNNSLAEQHSLSMHRLLEDAELAHPPAPAQSVSPRATAELAAKTPEAEKAATLQAKPRDIYKFETEFLPEQSYGTGKWFKADPDPFTLADKLEVKAYNTLNEHHRNLSLMNGHDNARVFPYRAHFTIDADMSPKQLAEKELGPHASQAQIKFYAQQLMDLNEKEGNANKKLFEAKSDIKLPGQTFDGGITSIDENGNTTTQWQDDSLLLQKKDGDTKAAWSEGKDTTLLSWSKTTAEENTIKHISDKKENIENADGSTTIASRKDAKSKWVPQEQVETDTEGRKQHRYFEPGSDKLHKVIVSKLDEKTQTFTRDKIGDLLNKDGNAGITDSGIIYGIKKLPDGGQERLHETGTTEKLDAQGNLLQRQGRDKENRLYEESYRAGEVNPYKVDVTINSGDAPTTFTRSAAGRYVAPYLLNGKPVGEIELDKGYFEFNDKTKRIVTDQQFDGSKSETFNLPFDQAKKIDTDKNATVVTEYDRDGNKKSRTYTQGDDWSLSRVYNSSGSVDEMTIRSKLGTADLKNDRDVGKFLGQGTSQDGKTAGVYISNGRLVYPPDGGDVTHSKVLVLPSKLEDLSKPIEGEYNDNLRTVKTVQHGQQQVESVDSGRIDTIRDNGTIAGHTSNGERSYVKPTGEAMVIHSDSTVRLNADETIDRWGSNKTESAKHEALSSNEKAFLDKNKANIDLRDLAEIHRRLKGDKTQLDAFYGSLSRVDQIPSYDAAEKNALMQNIMHHVGNPADIYQGAIGTCNVAVLQRELAMTDPQRYASVLIDAASNNLVDPSTGKKVEVDPANLKLHDLSERDLASRIFQSMALNLLFSPGKYLNTNDTNGKLYDRSGNLMAFAGLNMAQINELAHKVSGLEHCQVLIKSPEDFITAFEKNGRRPMTISVDARKPPIVPTDSGTGGHVVTVVGVERQGDSIKVKLQNQWGLADDHSTPETEVDAAELAENMKDDPLAIILGKQGDVYKIVDGKLVLDEESTRAEAQALERSMN